MPALIGGFFRRGRLVIVCYTISRAKTPESSSAVSSKESRLEAVIISNEEWLQGSLKWEKSRYGLAHSSGIGHASRTECLGELGYLSTLPSLVVILSWTRVNSHFKDGSAIINSPSGLKFTLTGGGRLGSVCLWTLPGEHTITESNLKWNPSNMLNQLLNKHGNPGTMLIIGLVSSGLIIKASLTYVVPKQQPGLHNRHGGKIKEEANAKGNALDIRSSATVKPTLGAPVKGLLLNSWCLNRASNNLIGCRNMIRDPQRGQQILPGARLMSTLPTTSLQEMREEVEGKQKELVELARLKGVYDPAVLKLQLILSRSKLFREYAVKLISIKPGSQTPGVDREIYDKEEETSFQELSEFLRSEIYHPNKYKAKPVKRVWIPKPGKDEKRPLGIPTVKDRALQMLINLVLLPLVELTSDPNSYGFRPYRDCKMAIAAVRAQLKATDSDKVGKGISKRNKRDYDNAAAFLKLNQDKWILDADIKGFFNNINHEWLLNKLFLHPDLKRIVEQWLKAKILDEGRYIDPLSGTPQGGIISPTLANFTLNGLEKAVKEAIYPLTKSVEQRYSIKLADGNSTRIALSLHLVRYADDFVIIARSQNLLNKYIIPAVNEFLKERGLWLSPEKTKQFSLSQKGAQLNFLGYTFKFRKNWSPKRTMVYSRRNPIAIAVYPNRVNVIAFIRKIKSIFEKAQNASAIELISELNPIIRGWANYYNLDNSSRYRSVVREALYRMTWEWLRKKHPTLGKKRIAEMYFLRKDEIPANDATVDQDSPIVSKDTDESYIKFKNHKWVLYGKSSKDSRYKNEKEQRVAYLLNPVNTFPVLATTKYLLPTKLRTINAFDDGIDKIIMFKLKLALTTSAKTPTLKEKLFKLQDGLCTMCNKPIEFDYLHFNTVHIHHKNPIKKGGDKLALKNLALTHSWCHREHKH